MIAQKLTVECTECGICRCNLNDYIGTVCAVFHHFPDTAYLTFDTVKAVNKGGIFFLGALLCLMTAPAEKAEYLEKLLKEKFGANLSIFRNHDFAVEIMPKNVDKASVLEEMRRIIGITEEVMITCESQEELLQALKGLAR